MKMGFSLTHIPQLDRTLWWMLQFVYHALMYKNNVSLYKNEKFFYVSTDTVLWDFICSYTLLLWDYHVCILLHSLVNSCFFVQI
jgi:hypothetical protein